MWLNCGLDSALDWDSVPLRREIVLCVLAEGGFIDVVGWEREGDT